MARLLIVEDEAALMTVLKDRLRKDGYEVGTARNGPTGLEFATLEKFNLLILDLMLPGLDGLDLCRKLRRLGSAIPILMLTARRQTADKLAGFDAGASDYMIKPFQMAELLARVEALLRRTMPDPNSAVTRLQFGPLHVDLRGTQVTRSGQQIDLSAKEFHLLRYFVEHRGETVSRDQLLRDVWGYSITTLTHTIDVHVASLRQKIEDNPRKPQLILTVFGVGYRFTV